MQLIFCLLHAATFCDAFSIGYLPRSCNFPVKMRIQKTGCHVWVPILPEKVDFTNGAILTEVGVTKDAFQAFFSRIETSSYEGFKWELVDNKVFIYDMADTRHEVETGAFVVVFVGEAIRGRWVDDIIPLGSAQLRNPEPNQSDWQPDSSILPIRRLGPIGSHDKLCRYPTMVLEVASSETTDHVVSKAKTYLGPNTSVQIVLVLLIRPSEVGAVQLEVRKFERGQTANPWSCSFADPACLRAGDPAFQLQLPVALFKCITGLKISICRAEADGSALNHPLLT